MTKTTDALAMIDKMTINPSQHPYRGLDIYGLSDDMLRDLLFENGDSDALDYTAYKEYEQHIEPERIRLIARQLADALNTIASDEFNGRQALTELLLKNSICPVHLVDYAACFDDDEPDCALIREYFPNHDT